MTVPPRLGVEFASLPPRFRDREFEVFKSLLPYTDLESEVAAAKLMLLIGVLGESDEETPFPRKFEGF